MAKRNTYTPEYKAKIVIEILEGEQTISEIASREGINVNQLKNWKKEFLENASRAFNGSKSEKEAKRAAENSKKREEKLMQKIGHLTVQVDWLKKKSDSITAAPSRKSLSANAPTVAIVMSRDSSKASPLTRFLTAAMTTSRPAIR